MPKDTKLNIVVDNAQAIPAIDETGRAVENLRKTSRGASKDTGKDWGGIADLFSSVCQGVYLSHYDLLSLQVGR